MDLARLLPPLGSAIFGMALGSFLNVCIDRLPAGQSIVGPPSLCPYCGRRLSPTDLIPVLSYLRLRGRCRSCAAPIPVRVLIVEALTGLLLSLLCWRYGLSSQFAMASVYVAFFIAIFFIDLERQLVPDKIVYPAILVAAAFSFLLPGLTPLRALLGGAAGAGIMLSILIVSRGGIGMGDVKLMAFLGLAVGFPHVLILLLLAVIAGGLVATALLLSRTRGRRDAIPFAPFLVSGGFLVLLYGQQLYGWYIGLITLGVR